MKKLIPLCFVFFVQLLLGQVTNQEESVVVVEESIVSDHVSRVVYCHIYLPDAYHLDTEKSFPVIYWLHGSGGYPPGLVDRLANRFHRAIDESKMPPSIVVFLDDGIGDSMWVNWKDGTENMESVIIKDLIPYIDKKYRTINDRRGRILEGGSMGGYGAARLGFKYPELFSAISLLNPGPMHEIYDPKNAPVAGEKWGRKILDKVYGGDAMYFREQSPWHIAEKNAAEIKQELATRIIIGGSDPGMNIIRKFSEHLHLLEIAHEVMILEGAGHNPKAMFSALDDRYWDFFNRNLSAAVH